MRRYGFSVLCIMTALTVLTVTACKNTEPTYTVVTTVVTEAGGIGNPWKEALTLEEAAYGANLNDFVIDESALIDGAPLNPLIYKYTDCIAMASYSLAGTHIEIRKSTLEYCPSGDVAGTYNDYSYEWTADVNGIPVKCGSFVKGKVAQAVWVNGDLCYSICIDHKVIREDGLSEAAVRDLVNAVR